MAAVEAVRECKDEAAHVDGYLLQVHGVIVCLFHGIMHICIIGASQGLGRALSEELLRQGHSVWAVARRAKLLETIKRPEGAQYFWSQGDVTKREDIEAVHTAMQQQNFTPDCVVLNAGVQKDDMQQSYDHASGSEVIETNLLGILGCVNIFLPAMLKRRGGSLVAIASTAAMRPSLRSASYAASKAGLAMAFRSFRGRYAGEGVQFKTVYLGPIRTEMWEGKKSWLVPDVAAPARRIATFLGSRRATLYTPFLSTLLLRLAAFVPDSLFRAVSSTLLR